MGVERGVPRAWWAAWVQALATAPAGHHACVAWHVQAAPPTLSDACPPPDRLTPLLQRLADLQVDYEAGQHGGQALVEGALVHGSQQEGGVEAAVGGGPRRRRLRRHRGPKVL